MSSVTRSVNVIKPNMIHSIFKYEFHLCETSFADLLIASVPANSWPIAMYGCNYKDVDGRHSLNQME